MGWLHSLEPLENRLSDFFVRQHARTLRPDPDIVVISIDDASLAKMEALAGSWPWPRSVHAELLNGISLQQPKAVVFDLSFIEHDVYRPESDALLNQALEGKNNVYFPLIRQPSVQDVAGPALAQVAPQLGILHTERAVANAHIAVLPPMAIDPRFWRLGTVNFLNDADGVGRRYHLYTDVRGWLLPSLPARVASDLGYPVPREASMILSWRGGLRPYVRIPYADLYEDLDKKVPARAHDELRDKIVVIGTDASALHDIRVTPIDSLYSGLDILATAIDNLKNQRFMHAAAPWISPGIFVLFVLIAALGFFRNVHMLAIAAALLALSILYLSGSFFALRFLTLFHPLTALSLGWAYFAALALREYLHVRKSRQQTVQLFSRFVNPHVVKELVASGGLSRAGECREISVLFSDIRGFTSMSEKRTPQELVTLLNRYFSLQVEVIFRHGGSLDKFIGDCIMAFWGAPLDDPLHARHAVEAAIEMTQVLRQFKLDLGIADEDFEVGIGIHSGPAVVGLIGSEQRREYTAIGDTVNLASRIEGLTKEVAQILVSRETMAMCGKAHEFQSLGRYKVKGRAQEVEVFRPVISRSVTTTIASENASVI